MYCDVSAFGHGPEGSRLKGYDPIVQAFSGIMDMTGDADGGPARCATPLERAGFAAELAEALGVPLSKRTAAEWLERFHAAGIPSSLVLGVDEEVRSPIAAERDWFETVGSRPLVRLPILLDGAPLPARAPAPGLGEHSRVILAEAGLSSAEIDELFGARVAA